MTPERARPGSSASRRSLQRYGDGSRRHVGVAGGDGGRTRTRIDHVTIKADFRERRRRRRARRARRRLSSPTSPTALDENLADARAVGQRLHARRGRRAVLRRLRQLAADRRVPARRTPRAAGRAGDRAARPAGALLPRARPGQGGRHCRGDAVAPRRAVLLRRRRRRTSACGCRSTPCRPTPGCGSCAVRTGGDGASCPAGSSTPRRTPRPTTASNSSPTSTRSSTDDDVVGFDLEPGDVLAFHFRTLHDAPGATGRRRASQLPLRRRRRPLRVAAVAALAAVRPDQAGRTVGRRTLPRGHRRREMTRERQAHGRAAVGLSSEAITRRGPA